MRFRILAGFFATFSLLIGFGFSNAGATSAVDTRVFPNPLPVETSDSTFKRTVPASYGDVVPDNQPDIVVIMTDDQRVGTEKAMPYTWKFFNQPRGVAYPNTQVPTNLCCPSRAAFLSGRYATSTNVWDNQGIYGGYKALRTVENDLLPVWLHDANYTTGLFGKLVNKFPGGQAPPGYVPPGWDAFNVFEGPKGADYWGNIRGIGEGTYSTDSLGVATSQFIANAPKDKPLFAYYAPFAPHLPLDAGPYKNTSTAQQRALVKNVGGYKNSSYNMVSRSQSRWMRQLPKVKHGKIAEQVRKTADMLNSIDANVRRITQSVEQHRKMNNTIFVYLGDNGIAWGDHRFNGKRNPLTQVNEVPLMVRYPKSMTMPVPKKDTRLANNVDVTATLMELGTGSMRTNSGITLPGRSLISPLKRAFLPLQAAATKWTGRHTQARPAYCGVRTQTHLYLRYGTGEEELYDLERDRQQTKNVAYEHSEAYTLRKLRVYTATTNCNLNYLASIENDLAHANDGD